MDIILDETRDFNEGVWRDYDKQNSAKIRPTTRQKYRELRKEATIKQKGFRQAVLDDDLFDELLYDWMIEEWKGPKDRTGKPLPCTSENKMKVVNIYSGYAAWVVAESEAYAEENEIIKGEETKNSTTGQDGRRTAQEESEAAAPAKSSES